MKLRASLFEQTRSRFLEFFREPSAFIFVILMPMVWMLTLGFAFSDSKVKKTSVGVVGQSAVLTSDTQDAPMIVHQGSADDIEAQLKRGQIVLIVSEVQPGKFTFRYDPKNDQAQLASLQVEKYLSDKAGQTAPYEIEKIYESKHGSRYIDFLIPGLMALSIMTSSLFGVGMTIVSNRRNGLFKRYLATPMKPSDYIVSHVFGRMLVLTVEIGAILLGGYFIFGFEISGSVPAFLSLLVLGAACFTAIGILFGSRTETIGTISGLVNLTTFTLMIVSGVFFSVQYFPSWFATVTSYLPLSPLVEGLRMVATEGASIPEVTRHMSVLAAYFVACSFAAKRLFKWF
ncbi:MAG: ABC transporter permease [Oligoflexales bacterium]